MEPKLIHFGTLGTLFTTPSPQWAPQAPQVHPRGRTRAIYLIPWEPLLEPKTVENLTGPHFDTIFRSPCVGPGL